MDGLPRAEPGLDAGPHRRDAEPRDAEGQRFPDAGLETPQDASGVDAGAPLLQADSPCFDEHTESTEGRFVSLFVDDERDDPEYVLISEPTQQGCLWVQGGILVRIGVRLWQTDGGDSSSIVEVPSRQVGSTVWACNACDRAVQLWSMGLEWGTRIHGVGDVFGETPWDSGTPHTTEAGKELVWPSAADYRATIKDNVTRVDFPDGTSFGVSCSHLEQTAGAFSHLLEPNASIQFPWIRGGCHGINPPQDLPDSWEAPQTGMVKLIPSVHLGDDPLQIPEFLPRVCRELGFSYSHPWGEFCSGHCLPSFRRPTSLAHFQLPPEECPYECPQNEPMVQVEIPIVGPYPEGLFYAKQSCL